MAVWRIKKSSGGTLLEKVLSARGLAESDLNPSLPRPDGLPNLRDAVRVVSSHLDGGSKVAVFGDYDCDGVCGAVVLEKILRRLGADVIVRLPLRDEGYGIRPCHVKELAGQGVGLIVTVDNGVSGHEAVRAAGDFGVSVVVTDHHEPRGRLPECPVVDPKLSSGGFRDYCGAAVAWLFGAALCEARSAPVPEDLLGLVSLATVVDVVPVVGHNRALAREGLMQLRKDPPVGVKALARAAGVDLGRFGGPEMAWQLGPRVNAAGRMGDPAVALRLLLTDEEPEAAEIAEGLNRLNRERQEMVEAAVCECMACYDGSRFPVFVQDVPHGIAGVVAGRLVERLRVPVLVGAYEEDGNRIRCSGRTIGGFDLLAAVEECRRRTGFPKRFGGHVKACGVTLTRKTLPLVRAVLSRIAAERLRPEDVAEWVDVDGVLDRTPSVEEVQELDLLEPFGEENPEPVFALTGQIESVRRGSGWQRVVLRGIKFFVPPGLPVEVGKVIHAAVTPMVGEWGGKASVAARAVDVRDFSLTREALAEAYFAWRKGADVHPQAKAVFEDLRFEREGPNTKRDLLESQVFRQWGAMEV